MTPKIPIEPPNKVKPNPMSLDKSKKHLNEAGESYAQHLIFASSIALKMLKAGIQCFLHALIPSIFKTSGSNAIKELYNKINTRD